MVGAVARKKAREMQAEMMIYHIASQGDQKAIQKAQRLLKPRKPIEYDDSDPMSDEEIDAFVERMKK